MRSRNTARTALGVTALVGLIVAEKRLMCVWWRWIKHRFPRLPCGRSWHGSFLPRAASKGSAVRHKGLRPHPSASLFRRHTSSESAGCAWSCGLYGHTSPAHPGPYACSRPCLLRSHETAPCASWPPAEREGRNPLTASPCSALCASHRFAARHPKRGLGERFSNPWKLRAEFFQGLEKYLPRVGISEREFSNAWNKMFQALEISPVAEPCRGIR